MSEILVVHYSSYGHVEVMGKAQAECRFQGEHVAKITARLVSGERAPS
jgi:hypothetical protein